MTIYECPRCKYSTSVTTSFISHLQRKIPCSSVYSEEPTASVLESFLKKRRESKKYICEYCNCAYKSPSSRSHHYAICNMKIQESQNSEVETLKSTVLNMQNLLIQSGMFSLENGQMVVKQHQQPGSVVNSNCNQIVQNNNIVVIREFGNENMDAIPKSLISDLILNLQYRELLENLHCDPDYPENNNVRLKSTKRQVIEIFKNNKWNPMTFVNALDEILLHANSIFQNHFRKHKRDIADDMTEEELEDLENKLYEVQSGLNENFIKPIQKEIQLMLESHRNGVIKKEEIVVISRPSRLI